MIIGLIECFFRGQSVSCSSSVTPCFLGISYTELVSFPSTLRNVHDFNVIFPAILFIVICSLAGISTDYNYLKQFLLGFWFSGGHLSLRSLSSPWVLYFQIPVHQFCLSDVHFVKDFTLYVYTPWVFLQCWHNISKCFQFHLFLTLFWDIPWDFSC